MIKKDTEDIEDEDEITLEDIDEVIEETKQRLEEKPHSWFKERKR